MEVVLAMSLPLVQVVVAEAVDVMEQRLEQELADKGTTEEPERRAQTVLVEVVAAQVALDRMPIQLQLMVATEELGYQIVKVGQQRTMQVEAEVETMIAKLHLSEVQVVQEAEVMVLITQPLPVVPEREILVVVVAVVLIRVLEATVVLA